MTSNEFLHLVRCKPEAAREAIARDPKLLRLKCLWGESPLHFLCTEKEMAAVKLLIEAGANVNVSNDCGDTPLSDAARLGHTGIVALLLSYGASPNTANDLGSTPLTDAIETNQLEILGLLLQHGASPLPTEDFLLEFHSALYHLKDTQRTETIALLDAHWGEGTCARLLAEYKLIYGEESET